MNVTVDTLKVKVTAEVCSLNLSKFDRKETVKSNGITFNSFSYSDNTAGLKGIQYRPNTGDVIIEVSAKVLKENYIELINLDTIQQVSDRINATGVIHLHVTDLLELSEVLRCDYCSNLKADKDLQRYLDYLAFIQIPNYRTDTYKRYSQTQSVIYKDRLKTSKDRLICYNKLDELKKASSKFDGLKTSDFNGMLRIERNVTDLKTLRKITGKTNGLTDCLTVSKLPNIELLRKIVMARTNKNKVINNNNYLLNCSFEYLIEQYNSDLHLIYEDLKRNMHRSTAYRKFEELKEYAKHRKGTDCTDELLKALKTLENEN